MSLPTARWGSGPTGRNGWDRPPRVGWITIVLLAVLAVGGLLLRVWILGNAPLNSDEATAGLVAHEIARGHFFAFYWGQGYGGVEPYVVALFFLVAGQSPLTLNGTPVVLSFIAAVLVWRIGLHLFRRPAPVVAAVLSWNWSESTLWNSTKEYGFHQVGVVLGLVVLLQAVRIVQGSRGAEGDRISDWLIFGGAVGLGYWSSPEIVYFALPGTLVVLMTRRHRTARGTARRVVATGVAAVFGALPAIWATATGNSTTIPSSPVPYLSRLGTFFSHVLPMILGLRIEGAGAWELGPRFGPVVYGMALVVVVGAAVVVAVDNRDALVLVLTLVFFPFLYAAFPTSWFWNDGRYAIGLTPVVALVVVGSLWQIMRPAAAVWVAGAVLLAAFASTVVAFNSGYGAIGSPDELTNWSADPNPAITSLARQLERMGTTHVYTGYWVANDLTFVSRGDVTAESVGESRNPPEATSVEQAATAGWVFVPPAATAVAASELGATINLDPGSTTEAELIAWLDRHGIRYRKRSTGVFDIVVPDRNVTPDRLAG
jgi:hypothetical protein